jgi:hypothetical protein
MFRTFARHVTNFRSETKLKTVLRLDIHIYWQTSGQKNSVEAK